MEGPLPSSEQDSISSATDRARPGADLRAVERLQLVGIFTLIAGSIGFRVLDLWTSVGDRWLWTLGVAFFVVFWAVTIPLGMRFSRMTFGEVTRAAFAGSLDTARRWADRVRRR